MSTARAAVTGAITVMSRTPAAHITQLSIPHQLEEYGRQFGMTVEVMSGGPAGPIRFVIDGTEMSPAEASEKYLGGFTTAHGRSAGDWAAFLASPWCLSPAAIAFREAWQAYAAAAETAAAAAIENIADMVRRVYPQAASITCASFRNDDGDDVLRLRGIWNDTGRRLAAIDDDAVDYAEGWPVGGNEADAEELAYDRVDPILSALVELDHAYLSDEIHTIDLPADANTAGGAAGPVGVAR